MTSRPLPGNLSWPAIWVLSTEGQNVFHFNWFIGPILSPGFCLEFLSVLLSSNRYLRPGHKQTVAESLTSTSGSRRLQCQCCLLVLAPGRWLAALGLCAVLFTRWRKQFVSLLWARVSVTRATSPGLVQMIKTRELRDKASRRARGVLTGTATVGAGSLEHSTPGTAACRSRSLVWSAAWADPRWASPESCRCWPGSSSAPTF